jgi:hypothetical protein
MTDMTELEQMKFHCQHWEGLYNFSDKTRHIVCNSYPFALIQEHGVLFNEDTSTELKSDEKLLINKAIKRIGKIDEVDYMLTISTPVRVAFCENSDKLKLFHGLIYKEDKQSHTELTWLVINGRVIDLANNIMGLIPKGYIYYGIEIPKEILNKAILKNGMSVHVDKPNYEYKPNATTILMKSLDELTKFYGQNGENNKKQRGNN